MDFCPVKKISLANIPTKIERLAKTSAKYHKNIFIKRDDQTGTELSGNKVRKLEYAIAEAVAQGCVTIVTCGGLQSNHCRATAAAAAMQGMQCILLLAAETPPAIADGNLLLDHLFGAQVRFIAPTAFETERQAAMDDIMQELAQKGHKGYSIPLGASNGIGTFGYFEAMNEITTQEKNMNTIFDTIICTVGSGGTYAGLCLSNKINHYGKRIIGISISQPAEVFKKDIIAISKEFYTYRREHNALDPQDIHIIDGYAGRGYALNTETELAFIRQFACDEAIVLDPVYTGKALYGLCTELLQGTNPLLTASNNILFIHTGGLFGLFPKCKEFQAVLG